MDKGRRERDQDGKRTRSLLRKGTSERRDAIEGHEQETKERRERGLEIR